MPLLLILFLMLVPQADNPLATLKEEVKRVLSDARLPFTDDQEREIVLMMEDRRKASEDLFGTLMDFSAGPTQGQDADKLRSAIDWMRNEFLTRLQNYLSPEQLAAWGRHQESETTQIAANNPAQAARLQQAANAICPNQQQLLYGGIAQLPVHAGRRDARGDRAEAPSVARQRTIPQRRCVERRKTILQSGNRIPTVKPPYSNTRRVST
jgi:hypothetical protein